jgi:tRNA wybutosine-synthesizing protein 1
MDKVKLLLQNQGYCFTGNHSAVKICTWTKKSLKDEDFCYKQQFYGIQSHLCCQMSPAVGFCQNKCVYCWREIDSTVGTVIRNPDDPYKVIDNSILAQRKLLSGFGGCPGINRQKLKDAQNPRHFAVSLAGEPLIYPRINDLIAYLHSLKKTTFVVTNGLLPDRLSSIEPPTQMYLSLEAPDERLHKQVAQPVLKDAWKRQQKSLLALRDLKPSTKTVIRITAISGVNMVEPECYANLIRLAEPDFVEVKAYMFVGSSRQRLAMENMPLHNAVRGFAQKIAEFASYRLKDEKEESRVVLLSSK